MNRRSPLVLIAVVAGLLAVLTLHIGAPASILATAGARPTTQPQPQKTAASGSGPPAQSSGSATTAAATGSGAAGSVQPSLAIRRTQVGASEQYGYGILAVRVSVVGTRIVGVGVSQLQTADQYSQQLANQVIPMLRSQVLSAQCAHINGVSGASYTSQAYAMSLQSALDKLHVA
ncbi:MAG: FMN-binding protein [Solirubrobacteraceae bacterium]